jgi:hypothetical protein
VAETICESFNINTSRLVFDKDQPNGRALQSTDNSLFVRSADLNYLPAKEAIKIACNWFHNARENGSPLRI